MRLKEGDKVAAMDVIPAEMHKDLPGLFSKRRLLTVLSCSLAVYLN
jgi:hypothetical protein